MLGVLIILGILGCFAGGFYWLLQQNSNAPLLEHAEECKEYWKDMYKKERAEHIKCRQELSDLQVKQFKESIEAVNVDLPVIADSPKPTNHTGPEYYLYEENGQTKAAIRGTADYEEIERSIKRGR